MSTRMTKVTTKKHSAQKCSKRKADDIMPSVVNLGTAPTNPLNVEPAAKVGSVSITAVGSGRVIYPSIPIAANTSVKQIREAVRQFVPHCQYVQLLFKHKDLPSETIVDPKWKRISAIVRKVKYISTAHKLSNDGFDRAYFGYEGGHQHINLSKSHCLSLQTGALEKRREPGTDVPSGHYRVNVNGVMRNLTRIPSATGVHMAYIVWKEKLYLFQNFKPETVQNADNAFVLRRAETILVKPFEDGLLVYISGKISVYFFNNTSPDSFGIKFKYTDCGGNGLVGRRIIKKAPFSKSFAISKCKRLIVAHENNNDTVLCFRTCSKTPVHFAVIDVPSTSYWNDFQYLALVERHTLVCVENHSRNLRMFRVPDFDNTATAVEKQQATTQSKEKLKKRYMAAHNGIREKTTSINYQRGKISKKQSIVQRYEAEISTHRELLEKATRLKTKYEAELQTRRQDAINGGVPEAELADL
ncbi:hypothetical protein OAM67_00115 [bacterium]|nr:hypothetical protein [bacterium]